MRGINPRVWQAATLLTLFLAAPGLAGSKPGKVLIIGIDGCRPDALKAAKTPHLDRLVREGALSETAQTGPITVSGPGWSSMLTGVWAEKHGVKDNSFQGSNYDRYPHFFRRLKQARPEAKAASIAHWGPIHTRIVRDADSSAEARTDDEVADSAARLLTETNPDVVFLHFDDVDHAGHSLGFDPALPAYLAAIEKADEQVGRVLDALRARPNYATEDWLILASTDHGGTEKRHGLDIPEHRTIFLIASGPSVVPGRIPDPTFIVDVAATALVHLGVEIDPSWDLDGRPVALRPRAGSTP